MRKFLLRATQVFALVMIGTGFLVDTSFGDKNDTFKVAQALCSMAKGYFYVDLRGNFSCVYPTSNNGSTAINECTADGDCRLIFVRGKKPISQSAKGDGNKPPKPTKREDGPTTMTAGTVNDRGLSPKSGTASGAVVNGTLSTAASPRPAPAPIVNNPALPIPAPPIQAIRKRHQFGVQGLSGFASHKALIRTIDAERPLRG